MSGLLPYITGMGPGGEHVMENDMTEQTKKPRANAVVTTSYDNAAQTMTFEVAGGHVTVLNLRNVSSANRDRAFVHGMKQRISDMAAIQRADDGTPATPEQKFARMARLVDHYNSGAEGWSPDRAEGGARAKAVASRDPVIAAVAELQGMGYDDMVARIKGVCEKKGYKLKGYVAKLATQPDIVAKMLEIAQRGAGDFDEEDGEDLMGELAGFEPAKTGGESAPI